MPKEKITRADIGKQFNTELIMALNLAAENLDLFIKSLNEDYKPKQVTDKDKQKEC